MILPMLNLQSHLLASLCCVIGGVKPQTPSFLFLLTVPKSTSYLYFLAIWSSLMENAPTLFPGTLSFLGRPPFPVTLSAGNLFLLSPQAKLSHSILALNSFFFHLFRLFFHCSIHGGRQDRICFHAVFKSYDISESNSRSESLNGLSAAGIYWAKQLLSLKVMRWIVHVFNAASKECQSGDGKQGTTLLIFSCTLKHNKHDRYISFIGVRGGGGEQISDYNSLYYIKCWMDSNRKWGSFGSRKGVRKQQQSGSIIPNVLLLKP